MRNIDTVIYDLGGVLVDWQPSALFESLIPADESVAEFLAETDFMSWNLEHDRGVEWEVATAAITASHPRHAAAFAQYPQRFGQALVGTLPGATDLLRELVEANVRLLGLTNFARSNFELALAEYPWLSDFDGIVVSSHEGVVKPDPAIYRILIDRYGVDPATAVFIDDRPENVIAARELGFTGIDFINSAQLRESLVDLHVLPVEA